MDDTPLASQMALRSRSAIFCSMRRTPSGSSAFFVVRRMVRRYSFFAVPGISIGTRADLHNRAPWCHFVQKTAASASTAELMAKAHRVDHPDLVGAVLPRFDLGVDGIGDLLERRAREAPDKPFLVFYDDDARTRSDFTRQEFLVEVRKACKVLDDLGLKEGDAIATADEFNHSDTLVVLFAAWASGIMAVPLNLKEDDD